MLIVPVVLLPLRPVAAKSERLCADHVKAAFRAVHDEDWRIGLDRLREGAIAFRAAITPCRCGRPPCPGFSAPEWAWHALVTPAADLYAMALIWHGMEPFWRAKLHITWRDWLLQKFAMVYGREILQQAANPPDDRLAAKERLDTLLGSLAAVAVAGQRRGGDV